MNESDFELSVRQAAPELAGHPALESVLEGAKTGKRPLYPYMIREVVSLARRLAKEYRLPKEATDSGSSVAFRPTAGDYFLGKLLVGGLSPWVVRLREEGFSSQEPPFEDEGKAADWIEHTSSADLERWKTHRAERSGAREKIHELAREAGYRIKLDVVFLRYGRPHDDHVKRVGTVPNTFLEKLALETEKFSKKTGLTPDALVAHILVGLNPMIPRVRSVRTENWVRLPNGQTFPIRWETLTFYAADLSYEEVRHLYSEVRDYVGGKGTKTLTFEELEYLELVEDMGGPPRERKSDFWKNVLQEWKRKHPNEPPNSWKSAQEKFSGLKKRLPLLHQAKSPEEDLQELKAAAERFGPSQYPVDLSRFRRGS